MKANKAAKEFRYMDPAMIMTVVIALVILAVGVFAFFTVINQLRSSTAYSDANVATHLAINNTTTTAGQVFNVVGIVLIIGAIMTIVGLIMSYVSPRQ